MKYLARTLPALGAPAAILLALSPLGCSRAARVEAGQRPDRPPRRNAQGNPQRGAEQDRRDEQKREIPADAWKTPDAYWTAWRDKRLSAALTTSARRTYHASPAGSDDNPGTADRPWRTLQKAAATLGPGDMVILADGEYPGPVDIRKSGEPGRPITYRAAHAGLAVVMGDGGQEAGAGGSGNAQAIQNPKSKIQNPSAPGDTRDAIHVNHADYVNIEGLLVRNAPRAGIRVDHSRHVNVRGCRTVQNGVWGIFTNFSDDLTLEYNECAYSAGQHGIYVSNSADRPVLRYNSCHDNTRAGIQLNGDSKQRKPQLGKGGDGIIEDAVIEGNVLYENGSGGASALNLACVVNGRIVNNLIFNNLAGGISLFNDHRREVVEFGAKRNKILYNTIYFRPGEGRYCLSIKRGSTDNVVRNNILSGGRRGAFEFDDTASFVSDHNLIWSADPRAPVAQNEQTNARFRFEEWRQAGKEDAASVHASPEFVNPARAPFDFHLKSVPARGVEEQMVTTDLEGKPRGKRVVGCYE